MSSDKDFAGSHEHVAVAAQKKKHCARWWWAWLIGFIIVALLVVLLVIFVAVPKIAQSKLNAAQLEVQGISITQTQSNDYLLGINSTITTDGKVHAIVEPFHGYMYLEDLPPHTPFCDVDFPQTTSDAFQIVNVSQPVHITDMDAFTTFNSWLLDNETLRVTMTGDTYIQVQGISRRYPATFTKTVTLNGLNKFAGLNITNSAISLTADANGDNFHGTVDIPNRSIITMEIGNATFANFLNGSKVGTAFIDGLTLYPGMNTASMRANIEQAPVLAAISAQPYCQTGIVEFELTGTNVTNHGQYLAYFAGALASSNQTTDINIGAALKDSLNVTISCPAGST